MAQLHPRWSEFSRVAEWEGTLRLRGTSSGSASFPAYFFTEEWTESYSANVQMRLKPHPMAPGFGMFLGPMTGNADVVDKHTVRLTANCVISDSFEGSGALGPIDGETPTFHLKFETNGQYTMTLDGAYVRSVWKKQYSNCLGNSDQPSTQDFVFGWWPDNAPYRMPLPESGLVLRGGGTWKNKVHSRQQIGPIAEIAYEIEWELRPAGSQSEEEVIVTVPGLADWRPEAGPGGAKGNSITLNARLQKQGGGAPATKALKFEWEFANVSREPGYALNAPTSSPEKKPDMRFEPGDNLLVTDEEGIRGETPGGHHEVSSATVSSWDWGGFAEVRVTAVLPDGRRIIGYLEGDSAQKAIRLPKRPAGDHIAEVWRIAKKVPGISDYADDDNIPLGDGNRGDGLTLYEEYRGFIENGVHIEGDVDRKDYFILNRAGGAYLPGILLFAREANLAVHHEFTEAELPASRVINANRADGPNRVDQHGVIIRPVSPDQTYAIANTASGYPGTPRDVTTIDVPRIVYSITGPKFRSYLQGILVHELLHACNVYHHGENDTDVNWRYKDGSDDFIETDLYSGKEREVRIVRENGSRFAPVIPATGINMTLGLAGGQHSGHDGCFMRYDTSGAYIADKDPGLRYRVQEQTGLQICETTSGTGVNHFARDPQSRYKDASAGRGNCARQILVNDAVTAPQR